MKRYFLIIALFGLFHVSCSNWLDITPENQVAESDLFETGLGYETALNGIYQQLSEGTLYGKELTWGFLSAMSQNYDLSKSGGAAYSQAARYEFDTEYTTPVIENIWKEMYNALANTNNLIQRVTNESPDIFELKEIEKSVIEGEAYALRGMIHFDLLRLFAPAPVVDKSGSFLPYISKYPTLVENNISTEEYLKLVIADLEKGRELVAVFDTVPEYNSWISAGYDSGVWGFSCPRLDGYSAGGETSSSFFQYRGTRLNYYAITCWLARVYQYAGMSEKALENAKIILELEYEISPNTITFSNLSVSNMSTQLDKLNTKSMFDLMFALFNNDLDDLFFDQMSSETTTLYLRDVTGIFGNDSEDWRLASLIQTTTQGPQTLKYYNSEDNSVARVMNPLVPMFRLAEIHYIAGEAIFETDPSQAMEWLNDVRVGRGCLNKLPGVPSTLEDYRELIIQDACREYIAEGQLFFLYKRLNHEIIGADQSKVNYVLPIPASNDIF